jgi:hypothetical protein
LDIEKAPSISPTGEEKEKIKKEIIFCLSQCSTYELPPSGLRPTAIFHPRACQDFWEPYWLCETYLHRGRGGPPNPHGGKEEMEAKMMFCTLLKALPS